MVATVEPELLAGIKFGGWTPNRWYKILADVNLAVW